MPTGLSQILILGTYHMARPNQDYARTNHGDVASVSQQQQIEELVGRFAAFRPTHVAIEREPSDMPRVLARYQQYRAGNQPLEQHEWEQVGFRIASMMGHERLYGIDYRQPLDFERAIGYAVDHGMTPLIEDVQAVLGEIAARTLQLEADGNLLDLHEYLNSLARDELDHSLYMRVVPLGAGDKYIGANLLAGWYAWNLKLFANIAALAAQPGGRVFVLVGASHRRLLCQFVLDSPNLELVDPLPYLRGHA